MSVAWRLVEEAFDCRQEAHVGHTVGLVDDNEFDVAQFAAAASDQVFESTRTGNKNVNALFESLDISFDAGSTEDRNDGSVLCRSQRFEFIFDLRGQLASRRQDQD